MMVVLELFCNLAPTAAEPAPPDGMLILIVVDAVSEAFVILRYSPPPPPPPELVAFVPLPPLPPAPMASIVLLLLFQSAGTAQVVPDVKMICVMDLMRLECQSEKHLQPQSFARLKLQCLATQQIIPA
jgi:hypothetical protein